MPIYAVKSKSNQSNSRKYRSKARANGAELAVTERVEYERTQKTMSMAVLATQRKSESSSDSGGGNWEPTDSPNVNPLAHPKGKSANCEVCDLPAYYSCQMCRSCFYCTKEHMLEDMKTMHVSVCHIIASIKPPLEYSSSREAREKIKANRWRQTRQIVDIAFEKARHSLQKGRFAAALLQVTYSLRFAKHLYQIDDIAMIPFFLVISEVYGVMGKPDTSLKYMAKTAFIMLKNPDCPSIIKADYHKTHGIIDMAAHHYKDALDSFANEVYHATQAYHPEHARTADGYYNLGTVFLKLRKTSIYHSLFMHTVDILITVLYTGFQHIVILEGQSGGFLAAASNSKAERGNITHEALNDIRRQLTLIYDDVSKRFNDIVPDSKMKLDFVKVCYTLSLFHYVTAEYHIGLQFLNMANRVLDRRSSFRIDGVVEKDSSPTSVWVEKLKLVKKHLQRQQSKQRRESV